MTMVLWNYRISKYWNLHCVLLFSYVLFVCESMAEIHLKCFCSFLELALVRVNQNLRRPAKHHRITIWKSSFIIKLVNPWHQFRCPCRVSKCHTESLLYCLVISDSVASGATWWCSSNLSWRSKMCCPNPESALQHQHQDDLLSISIDTISASIFQRPSFITSSSKLPPRLKDLIGRSLTLFWVIGSRQNTLDDPQCHAVILNGLPQKVELWENVRKCEKMWENVRKLNQKKQWLQDTLGLAPIAQRWKPSFMLPRHSSGVPWLPSILRCHMESNIEIALRCQRVCFDHLWCMFTGRNQDSLVDWTRA